MVRLLNQGGTKLHDILIDGVYDRSETCPHCIRTFNAVRIGDNHMYGSRHATEDETYNITVRNVYSAGVNGVKLAGAMKNVSIYGIECKEGTNMICDERGMELSKEFDFQKRKK